MQKSFRLSNIVIVVVLLILLPVGVSRGFSSFLQVALLFVHSQLPIWILVPAGIAVIVGTAYLLGIRLVKRRPRTISQ